MTNGKLDLSDQPTADDQLGRAQTAGQILRQITSQPWEWPVRVALLGGWGEGKSSVVKLLRRAAEAQGHVVVEVSGSTAATPGEFWPLFASKLMAELENNKILLRDRWHHRARSWTWKQWQGWRRSADLTDEGAKLAAAYYEEKWLPNAVKSARLVGDLLASAAAPIKPRDLAKIRKKLGREKRVIVVIDDLDRAAPELVPQVLLALRDVLELEGFAFVVPFDDEVLAGAIKHHNLAWKDSQRFLEKIFDFQIRLPEPDPSLRKRFVERMAAEHLPFLKDHPMPDDVADNLPASPRKLKGLIRHLLLYRHELERYGPNELDRATVWRLELAKQVDEAIASRFVKGILYEDGLFIEIEKEYGAGLDVQLRE